MPFLFIIILIVIILQSPRVKGYIGESIVRFIVGKSSEIEGKEKYVINDLLIERDDGKTSQIDHVVINRKGVFVIETKNYSGRIYGSDDRKEWTQVLNYGKVKNKFYSPVTQNNTHVYNVKKLLPKEIPVFSAVVFVKGNIHYIQSEKVYNLVGLYRFIKSAGDVSLSKDQMNEIYGILTKKDTSSFVNNIKHVQNIKDNQKKVDNNICPRCNGKLVVREGKNGKFLGCSNFPTCKFTKNI